MCPGLQNPSDVCGTQYTRCIMCTVIYVFNVLNNFEFIIHITKWPLEADLPMFFIYDPLPSDSTNTSKGFSKMYVSTIFLILMEI